VSSVEKMPVGYPPLSYCTTCGRDFSGDRMFDRHRTGTHEYLYSEGLKMEPMREDGRRCMTPDEMLEKGWRPMSEDELLASKRDRKRAGFGVELWFDQSEWDRARRAMSSRSARGARDPQDATGAAG
jgi:hypothetical protein